MPGTISAPSGPISTLKRLLKSFRDLLSVVIAFSIGALVQWLARLLWTYKFEQKSPLWSALFGGFPNGHHHFYSD